MWQTTILTLSNLLYIIGYVFYIVGILEGKAKPHRTTRFVLLIISGLATSSLLSQQNYSSLWLAGISFFMSLLIFILTIRRGMGGWSRLDIICLAIALLGILLWKVTDSAFVGLCGAIIADFTGCIPALVKTFKYPKTEVWTFFAFGTLAPALNLAVSKSWSFIDIAYPLYIMIIGAVFTFFVLRGNKDKTVNQ